MDSTAIVIAVIGLLGTLITGYLTFRSRVSELKKQQKNESQVAINAASQLLFDQIQIELIRRDNRIEVLEKKIVKLEKEKEIESWEREQRIEEEKLKADRLEEELTKERNYRIKIEKDFKELEQKVIKLQKENKELKNGQQQITKKIGTGELK